MVKNCSYSLDGWVHTHHQLNSFQSNILDNSSSISKRKNSLQYPKKTPELQVRPATRHQRSISLTNSTNPGLNLQTARYHIRRVVSHEWESEQKPIHNKQVANKCAIQSSIQSQRSEIKPKEKIEDTKKGKVYDSTQIVRRASVDAVSYPLLLDNPERRVSEAVGRVRRMLKIKLQRKK